MRDTENRTKETDERLERAIRELVGDENIAALVMSLKGRRCSEVEEALGDLWPYVSLRWVYHPRGPPPSLVFKTLVRALCKEEPSVIDKLVELAKAIVGALKDKLGG